MSGLFAIGSYIGIETPASSVMTFYPTTQTNDPTYAWATPANFAAPNGNVAQRTLTNVQIYSVLKGNFDCSALPSGAVIESVFFGFDGYYSLGVGGDGTMATSIYNSSNVYVDSITAWEDTVIHSDEVAVTMTRTELLTAKAWVEVDNSGLTGSITGRADGAYLCVTYH